LQLLCSRPVHHQHPIRTELTRPKGGILDDKIEYAAKLLPPHLRPEHRPNPIDVLHDLTSDGLHSKSEEECVEIFDRVRKVFEYVFGNLNVQIEEARTFVKNLEGLKSPPKSSSKQKADRGC
jgi:hypothetical protein